MKYFKCLMFCFSCIRVQRVAKVSLLFLLIPLRSHSPITQKMTKRITTYVSLCNKVMFSHLYSTFLGLLNIQSFNHTCSTFFYKHFIYLCLWTVGGICSAEETHAGTEKKTSSMFEPGAFLLWKIFIAYICLNQDTFLFS